MDGPYHCKKNFFHLYVVDEVGWERELLDEAELSPRFVVMAWLIDEVMYRTFAVRISALPFAICDCSFWIRRVFHLCSLIVRLALVCS